MVLLMTSYYGYYGYMETTALAVKVKLSSFKSIQWQKCIFQPVGNGRDAGSTVIMCEIWQSQSTF